MGRVWQCVFGVGKNARLIKLLNTKICKILRKRVINASDKMLSGKAQIKMNCVCVRVCELRWAMNTVNETKLCQTTLGFLKLQYDI